MPPRREVDIGMSSFLEEETVGKETAARAQLSREELRRALAGLQSVGMHPVVSGAVRPPASCP